MRVTKKKLMRGKIEMVFVKRNEENQVHIHTFTTLIRGQTKRNIETKESFKV